MKEKFEFVLFFITMFSYISFSVFAFVSFNYYTYLGEDKVKHKEKGKYCMKIAFVFSAVITVCLIILKTFISI